MDPLTENEETWFERAHRREQRRKSPWNFLLFLLSFGNFFLVWYTCFRLVWAVHTSVYPDHEFRDFWPKGISFLSFVPSFLMLFAPSLGSLGLGFILANLMMWLIPPARRAFEEESIDYPGTSFAEAMRGLVKVTGWLMGVGLSVALIAALCLTTLK